LQRLKTTVFNNALATALPTFIHTTCSFPVSSVTSSLCRVPPPPQPNYPLVFHRSLHWSVWSSREGTFKHKAGLSLGCCLYILVLHPIRSVRVQITQAFGWWGGPVQHGDPVPTVFRFCIFVFFFCGRVGICVQSPRKRLGSSSQRQAWETTRLFPLEKTAVEYPGGPCENSVE
jgi:hypothetical protein